MCSYHIDVRPLASGRSGTVSGEVALSIVPSLVLLIADVYLVVFQ
jgi:hypothetical protein